MIVIINRITFKSLRNSEYPILVKQISEISGKYPITGLHLTKPYEKLKLCLPDIAMVKKQELDNILSDQIQDFDNDRDALLNAILAQVKNLSRVNMPGLKEAVEVMDRFLHKHGNNIAADNYNAETKRINDLLADYDATPEVKAAAAALNITMLFDQLKIVNTGFASLFLQRTESEAAEEKTDTRAIRNLTDKALLSFFNAIEYCSEEYDDLDYTGLANELNDLISYYKTRLKARATHRNNGNDDNEEPETKTE